MAKLQHEFFYYDQFGEICAGKAPIDDGVLVGGGPERIARFPLSEHEYELTLDQLQRIYPYNG